MANLKYIIDDVKLDGVVADWVYLYKNDETIADPAWGGKPEDAPRIPKYTDLEWMDEYILRWINGQLERSRQKQATDDIPPITKGEVTKD